MKKTHQPAMFTIFLVALTGCGGGNNSSSPTVTIAPEVFTGVFTDSPVNNLSFRTTTQSGRTNTAGEFQYQAGETVEFSIGGIILGAAPASAELSPLNLAGVTTLNEAVANSTEHEVINRILFLQSLDRDQNPDNGIDLEGLDAALTSETLDFSDPEFLQGRYLQIINNNNGYFQSQRNALNHLLETLQQTVTVELPIRDSIDTDGDGEFDQIIELRYNQQGQLIERVVTDVNSNTSTTLQEIEYDDNGNPIRIVTGSNIETIEYHPLFGVISSTTTFEDAILFSNNRTFDAIGNIITLSNIVNFQNFPELQTELTGFNLVTGELPPTASFAVFASTVALNLTDRLTELELSDVLQATGPPEGIRGITPIDYSSFIAELRPPNTSTTINNTFNEQGHLSQSILTTTIGESSFASTSNFTYENGQPAAIGTTINLPSSPPETALTILTEIDFQYNSEGTFLGCEQSINQSPSVNDPGFFAITNPSSSLPGTSISADMINAFITCSELVEYDEQGRVTKIEQPTRGGFFPSLTKLFEYSGNEVTRTTLTIASDPIREEVRSFEYSTTGKLIEASITNDGELSFARRLEYASFVLDQLPQQ